MKTFKKHLFLSITATMLGLFLAATAQAEEKQIYLIQFDEPGLSQYTGDIPGLRATSPQVTGTGKLDVKSPDSTQYLEWLKARQQEKLAAMQGALNREIKPVFEYRVAFNGMAVKLTPEEAAQVARLDGIKRVEADKTYELHTDAGPLLIGADTIWNGSNMPGNVPNKGEGVVIGVIDTGINFDHPSFSDTPEDGYDFASANPLGAGNFIGWCDPANPNFDPAFVCNDKHIGAWDFADAVTSENDGPEDSNGHGSHTAGTAAGNTISAPPGGFIVTTTGAVLNAPSISGVAPHAHIINYDVCDQSCPGSAIAAAINQAIADGVDVISFSISGGLNPWNDSDRIFLDAVNAGIVVSASAGNTSSSVPNPVGNVNHLGPWMLTVAASTHHRANSNDVSATGPGTPPANTQNLYGLQGSGPALSSDINAPAIYAGNVDPANFEGCNPWPNGNEFSGAVALISRGACTFADKVNNATNAGAVSVVVYNNADDAPIVMGGLSGTSIPSVMVGLTDGTNLRDFITSSLPAAATIEILAATTWRLIDSLGNKLASFSFRGPNDSFSVTKPDITGPGVNIMAAYADSAGAAPQYGMISGTSMSAPHLSGAAALIIAAHPTWSPAEVRSALMMTADKTTRIEDGSAPATPDDVGSGMVDLRLAAKSALTMNETYANYLAANPATGGNPANLNLPSLRDNDCNGTCVWYRTFTNRGNQATTWSIQLPGSVAYTMTSLPSNFTLQPGESVDVTFCAQVNSVVSSPVFSEVLLSDTSGNAPDARLTVAITPTATSPTPAVACTDLIFMHGFE